MSGARPWRSGRVERACRGTLRTVLVVHPHLHRRRTGVTRHVEEMVRALASDGAAVLESRWTGRVVAPHLPQTSIGAVRRSSVPLVWHAHRNVELFLGLALRALGAPLRIVWTRHAATPPSLPTRLLSSRADAVVALTQEVASRLARPATVVGHGVDLSRFGPPSDRALAWGRLEVGGLRGLGVVGRVRPPKGQGVLAEALCGLLPGHGDWRAVLVGRAKSADRR